MSEKVNRKFLEAAPTDLEVAGAHQDKFVATLGDLVTRKLAEILEKGDDDMARVSAGKALLEWIRPKKGAAITINNTNAIPIKSHLSLPAGCSATATEEEIADAEIVTVPLQRILPEPPGHLSQARLTSRREVQMDAAPEPPQLPDRSQKPSPPEMPPAASTVKQFPTR